MSINPVQGTEANQASFAEARAREDRPSPAAGKSFQSDSGNAPKPKVPTPASVPASLEMLPDEVQVQRDGATNGAIVIKYLDHAGGVILQIPSSQVLALMRAIDQYFQEAAKAREKVSAEQAGSEGEKAHGH
jgi:ABC-type uncharacterized transport system involved in gliding motility auxiliary subunit